MADEYESTNADGGNDVDGDNVYYSPFWPLTIVLAALILWLCYQVFILNQSRIAINSQLEQNSSTLQQAEMAQNRLVSMLNDLAETSQKDPYAKQIMKEAVQAGLIRVNPNASAPTASAAPDSSNDSTGASNK